MINSEFESHILAELSKKDTCMITCEKWGLKEKRKIEDFIKFMREKHNIRSAPLDLSMAVLSFKRKD